MKVSTYTSNVLSQIVTEKPNITLAKFEYVYFTPDESINEGPKPGVQLTKENLKTQLLKTPRFIEIAIKPPVVKSTTMRRSDAVKMVRDNISKIYSAEDIGNTGATTVVGQDTNVLERVYDSIERAAEIRGIEGNFTDITADLGRALSGNVDRNYLQSLGVKYSSAGAYFAIDRERLHSDKFAMAKNFPICTVIADKFISDAIEMNPPGIAGVTEPVSAMSAAVLQVQARARREVQQISSNDYVTIVDPISVKSGSSRNFDYDMTIVAILVYRKEDRVDGVSEVKLIDVLPHDTHNFIDFQVRYGSQYHYWTHAVYVMRTSAITANTGQAVTADILIQSQPSNVFAVTAVEDVAPPPPADLSLRWDYQQKNLVLSWAFPTNTQRDIKYFQVFKRKSLDEPFELILEYDFNDNLADVKRPESVLETNSVKVSSPITVFTDRNFKKSDTAIYAIGCVDARGLVSNYSSQIEASFDITRNRLLTKQVSPGNAPRPYPNVFIKGDLFLDSIVTTNKRRVRAYFDPEYLKIQDRNGNDMSLFGLKGDASYNITIVDIDRAQQIVLKMYIDDLLQKGQR